MSFNPTGGSSGDDACACASCGDRRTAEAFMRHAWRHGSASADGHRLRSMLGGLLPLLACPHANTTRAAAKPALYLVAGLDLE